MKAKIIKFRNGCHSLECHGIYQMNANAIILIHNFLIDFHDSKRPNIFIVCDICNDRRVYVTFAPFDRSFDRRILLICRTSLTARVSRIQLLMFSCLHTHSVR